MLSLSHTGLASRATSPAATPLEEHVVLLDARGRPVGVAPKRDVHGLATPFHSGFSCHVVDRDGRVLLTRRARTKRTWPGCWTNACCGHPQWAEPVGQAVARRLRAELGVAPSRLVVALPDFVYRSAMDDGTLEHELCPVFVAEVDGRELDPDPDEVGELEWVDWDQLCARARTRPGSLTPWSVRQVAEILSLARSPSELLDRAEFRVRHVDGFALAGELAPPRVGDRCVDPLAELRHPLSRCLDDFVASKSSELVELDPELAPVVEQIAALVRAGGKRLRPAFVYWGSRAAGADDDDTVVTVAAAVELLHTFALLHDDVIDRAGTRRGRLSAARALAQLHRNARLTGDAGWFGTSAAILAGDLTFVWADEMFDTAAADTARLAQARRVFNALRVEVMAGEYLDLRLAANPSPGDGAARRVALLKSGRYTVTRPLQLGHALADRADPDLAELLVQYGDSVGIAFQMRDDVLDLFGDPVETGKPAGDDLREGKRTVLVVRALSLADCEDRRFLECCLGNRTLDGPAVERCREIVATSGALASVEMLVHANHRRALDALTEVPEPARSALEALASLAIDRRS
jgi:isopentenyl-diphosphate delta-isomerase type 1